MTGSTPTYDADELGRLLEIITGADSVELKLTIPEPDQRRLLQTLEIDSLDGQVRQVAFLDTPDLRLSAAGLVVRARRTQRKPGNLTVKIRPMLPADAPADLRGHKGFKVEVDASPAGYTSSCSLTTEAPDRKVKALIAGKHKLSSLLDGSQRRLLLDRMPEGIDLGDLHVLGPAHLIKCKFAPDGFSGRMDAEVWFMPDGTRLLELSTKCTPAKAFQVAAELKAFLTERGADLGAPQEMKTKTVLAAYSALAVDAPETSTSETERETLQETSRDA